MTLSPLLALADAYAALRPDTLNTLLGLYADHARFKDPFNDLTGRAHIGHVFEDMFARLHNPRFVVIERMGDSAQGFLTWEMHFALKSAPEKIHIIRGATHLRFNGEGRVTYHRDYWDVAEELYEKWPLIGALMRWLKRRLAA